MNTADKYGPFVSLGLLICCVFFYFGIGLDKIYGNFPTEQVLWSLPIAFFGWGITAFLDRGGFLAKEINGVQQGSYYSIPGFITTMIFGSCVFTAIFIMFGSKMHTMR